MSSDADFLSDYDASDFPSIAVAVDVAVLAVVNGALHAGVVRRTEQPQRGEAALVGTFVQPHETLDDAATRALRDKSGLTCSARQFHTFGAIDRDPRMRIVSVAFAALLAEVPPETSIELVPLVAGMLHATDGSDVILAFDHADILSGALAALRTNLDLSLWSFDLLPEEFTLRELQIVHEAVRGRPLNKPAFRKRLLDSGKLIPTGRLQTGGKFRPAELYTVNREWAPVHD